MQRKSLPTAVGCSCRFTVLQTAPSRVLSRPMGPAQALGAPYEDTKATPSGCSPLLVSRHTVRAAQDRATKLIQVSSKLKSDMWKRTQEKDRKLGGEGRGKDPSVQAKDSQQSRLSSLPVPPPSCTSGTSEMPNNWFPGSQFLCRELPCALLVYTREKQRRGFGLPLGIPSRGWPLLLLFPAHTADSSFVLNLFLQLCETRAQFIRNSRFCSDLVISHRCPDTNRHKL